MGDALPGHGGLRLRGTGTRRSRDACLVSVAAQRHSHDERRSGMGRRRVPTATRTRTRLSGPSRAQDAQPASDGRRRAPVPSHVLGQLGLQPHAGLLRHRPGAAPQQRGLGVQRRPPQPRADAGRTRRDPGLHDRTLRQVAPWRSDQDAAGQERRRVLLAALEPRLRPRLGERAGTAHLRADEGGSPRTAPRRRQLPRRPLLHRPRRARRPRLAGTARRRLGDHHPRDAAVHRRRGRGDTSLPRRRLAPCATWPAPSQPGGAR